MKIRINRPIVRTKDTCFGKPRIRGTRVTTSTILHCHEAGWSVAFIADEFDLTHDQIEAALRYERRQHRRLGRWVRGYLPTLDGTLTWRGREWYF
jgi:uncharacterized protein (DUF433 family)